MCDLYTDGTGKKIYKFIVNKTKVYIADLYHVDQLDCSISLSALHVLYSLQI